MLVIEEFKEFLEADGMLFRNSPQYPQNCLKELSDLVYVCYQYAANMGWDLDEAMFRVHQSNMSKLDDEFLKTYLPKEQQIEIKLSPYYLKNRKYFMNHILIQIYLLNLQFVL